MDSGAEKIGRLISQVREQRGLTQTQLAKKLGTSQSAVNRIEKGKQNVSLDMLGRISDVLNKEIIKVSSGSVNFKVEGGRELKGTIETKVSKNATMGLLAASLLNKGTTRLQRIPKIEEVYRIIEVLQSLEVSVKWQGEDLVIKAPEQIDLSKIDAAAARRTRTILMFLGSLMHSFSEFRLPYSGGCKLGERTVKPHLFALEDFGVRIDTKTGFYNVSVDKRKNPGEVVLYETGDTVTENALMAAAGRPHTTVIKMASANYMVQEMCFFLKKLGVKIEGIGTTTLKVTGLTNIRKNVSFAPSEDPIESMLFISIAAVTNSPITITRCPIEFLELELLKLKKMGFKYSQSKKYLAENGFTELVDITTKKHDGLVALEDKIHPMPFPGINIDNLPYFVTIAAVAKGRTLIHDWVYENRAIYYTELNKLGAQVTLADPHRVYVDGPAKFSSAEIVTPPALRPAVIILIAMLAAKGTSVLRNVYSISRGYEDLAERLNSIGANITVVRD